MALETLRTLVALDYHISFREEDHTPLHFLQLSPEQYQQPNGYLPHLLDLAGVVLEEGLTDLVEKLAENAHNVWAASRIKDGWTYGISSVSSSPPSGVCVKLQSCACMYWLFIACCHVPPPRTMKPSGTPSLCPTPSWMIPSRSQTGTKCAHCSHSTLLPLLPANRDTAYESVRTICALGCCIQPPSTRLAPSIQQLAREFSNSHARTCTFRGQTCYALKQGKWYVAQRGILIYSVRTFPLSCLHPSPLPLSPPWPLPPTPPWQVL